MPAPMQSTSALAISARLDALLSAIKPSPSSEFRRLTISNYICSVIRRCFEPHHQVEAFMFGSVPLRAVLPDGDIDISVFNTTSPAPTAIENGQGAGATSSGGSAPTPSLPAPGELRDTWALQLMRALEREASRPDAPFKIRDIQIIQAEVKLVKCVVSDIVVDVSFDTVGGLCTVAFLEAADRRIGQEHLFKRSILLLKAWCYYESRLLGAHHGLISSYALEVLVLYIFNLYHAELHAPLDVLRRFLAVLGSFDWEHYCLALQGPLPLAELHSAQVDTSMLPADATPLLDDEFMRQVLQQYSVQQYLAPPPQSAAQAAYAAAQATVATVQVGAQQATAGQVGSADRGTNNSSSMPVLPTAPLQQQQQGATVAAVPLVAPHFPPKHLNIVDPLLPSNNLGRSVSKASYARVKKALVLGSRTLEQALLKDPRSAVESVDHFFRSTWRSPVRMAADNQTFLARLGSSQLPPAAMEAIVAAASAAGFPLHVSGSSSRPLVNSLPVKSEGLPNTMGADLLAAQQRQQQQAQQAHFLAQQQQQQAHMRAHHYQQQQQPAAAQIALLQLLLGEPVDSSSWGQRQQQHGTVRGAGLQQQQQHAALHACSSGMPAASSPEGTSPPACAWPAGSGSTGTLPPAAAVAVLPAAAAAGALPAEVPVAANVTAPLDGCGGSAGMQAEHQASACEAAKALPEHNSVALQPVRVQHQAQAQHHAVLPPSSMLDGWMGGRPPSAQLMATPGMAATAPNTPVTPAAGKLAVPHMAANTQLTMLRQGALGVPGHEGLGHAGWTSSAASAAVAGAVAGTAAAASAVSAFASRPLAAAGSTLRHESPHSFFGGDLETMERNLMVARKRQLQQQQQQQQQSTKQAESQVSSSSSGGGNHAAAQRPVLVVVPSPVVLSRLQGSAASSGDTPLPVPSGLAGSEGQSSPRLKHEACAAGQQPSAALPPSPPGAEPASPEGGQPWQCGGTPTKQTDVAPVAEPQAAPHPQPLSLVPNTEVPAPAAASIAAEPNAGTGEDCTVTAAMASLPALRTSCTPQLGPEVRAPPPPQQQQSQRVPRSPLTEQHQLQAQHEHPQPPPLPIVPRGPDPRKPVSEDSRSPKLGLSYSAALRSSSRTSSSTSLASSATAVPAAAAPASQTSSPSKSASGSGAGTPLAGGRRLPWGRGSTGNLAALVNSTGAAAPAAAAAQSQRSWSAIAANPPPPRGAGASVAGKGA